MKYIWIVMLEIVYIIWTISAIKDFRYCIKRFNKRYIFEHLDFSTLLWFFVTFVVPLGYLFIYSVCQFFGLE